MKKDMMALNDALHRQLNILCDPSLGKEGLAVELERTEAVTKISKEIISNGRLLLDATKIAESHTGYKQLPKILKDGDING
jgi:hypothetical protein